MNELKTISQLPPNWIITNIACIAKLVRGVNYKKEDASKSPRNGYLPILRANNINGELNTDGLIYVPCDRIGNEQQIKKLDIVLAMSSGSKDLVGKAAQAKVDFNGGFGAFCGLVRPHPGLSGKFIGIFFQSPEYRKAISLLSSGININNLRREHIESMPIPLPPLNEQKRIVAKIEELLTKLDAGVAALKKVRAELKRYRQAVLKAAFEGKLTADWRKQNQNKFEPAATLLERIAKEREKTAKGKTKKLPPLDTANLPALPEGWEWTQVQEITSVLGDGLHGTPFYSDTGEYFFINGNNLNNGKIEIKKSTKRVTVEEYEKYKKSLNENTILVSINGTLGNTAFYNNEKLILGKSACYFNVIHPVNKFYVRYYITTQRFTSYAHKKATGSTIKNVGLKAMREFQIPLPPTVLEQQLIFSEIERHFSVADKIEQTIERSLKEADRLRQSILKKAFEGKLVSQDPTDEPAEKLLERIQKKA